MGKLNIKIENIPESELKPKFSSEENIGFGQIKTDRMFTANYRDGTWQDFTIKKFFLIF